MSKVYHTPIQVETICKNGSEKYGAKAKCHFWLEDSSFKIEVSQYGETKEVAEEKLMAFLKDKNNELELKDI